MDEAVKKYGKPEIINSDQGEPVYFEPLDRKYGKPRHKDQYGRQRQGYGQCLYRALLQDDKV